ncbi:MAG TPA: GatB/YqeY domain-containing protein [Kineosporiaceae bacterium]|nr:GatB/YqeY domain-containing protein [Kineosporiaceae bacterium]
MSDTTDAATPAATSLKERLQADLTTSMRARDEVRTAALRMALTAVRAEEVVGDVARQLSDDEVVTVLGREAKKRREAAAAFAGAGRAEQADRERQELAVLEAYLPAQLSDEDLTAVVAEEVAAVAAAGATGMAAMGRVMKAVQPRVAGKAEGGRVAAEVRRQLSV